MKTLPKMESSDELDAQVKEGMKASELCKADVIRQALRIGLPQFAARFQPAPLWLEERVREALAEPAEGAYDKNLRNCRFTHFFGDKVSTVVDTLPMNAQNPLHSILQQIARIHTMERGKLSVIKESSNGPFYKLQAREDGKNVTRYIPRDQVAAIQEAIAGYKHFESLTEEYAQQVIAKTREALASSSKKKTLPRNFSSPRTRRSSS